MDHLLQLSPSQCPAYWPIPGKVDLLMTIPLFPPIAVLIALSWIWKTFLNITDLLNMHVLISQLLSTWHMMTFLIEIGRKLTLNLKLLHFSKDVFFLVEILVYCLWLMKRGTFLGILLKFVIISYVVFLGGFILTELSGWPETSHKGCGRRSAVGSRCPESSRDKSFSLPGLIRGLLWTYEEEEWYNNHENNIDATLPWQHSRTFQISTLMSKLANRSLSMFWNKITHLF